MSDEQKLREARQMWDEAASEFDNEPDHGLRNPAVLQAWTHCLTQWLPPPPTNVLDVGCGTGSLSVVMASLGHTITGIDLSPAMIADAEKKVRAANQQITFHVMDASAPSFTPQLFDFIICRHVLWALPEPTRVLRRWADLLTPSGRMVLIEGYWFTEAGLHSAQTVDALPSSFVRVTVENLSENPLLWGHDVSDERYAIVADLSMGPHP